LLARFHESQLTQSEFATQNGVGLSTLSKWLRLERETVLAKVKFQEARRMLVEEKLETQEIVIEPAEVQAQPDGWKKISEEPAAGVKASAKEKVIAQAA
jgi:hypothetical protein